MTPTPHLNTDHLEPALDRAADRVDNLASRAASQVESITRHGLERARQATETLRLQAGRTGERTVGYVRDKPMKSMLLAVAAGATLAVLIGALTRRH